jgi:hypothetical protein
LEVNSPAKLAKKSVAGAARAAQPHKKVLVGIYSIFSSIFFVASTCKLGVKYNPEEAVKAASL